MPFADVADRLAQGILSLDDVLRQSWTALEHGAADRSSPWWTVTLFSAGADGANARTVVLRDVDHGGRRLTVYTDRRTQKMAELEATAGFVAYDPNSRVQLRGYGTPVPHNRDDRTRAVWQGMTPWARRAYLRAPASGMPVPEPSAGLPPLKGGAAPTEEELAVGYDHFVVIDLVLHRLDWLLLTDDGNRAARFDWDDAGALTPSWRVP